MEANLPPFTAELVLQALLESAGLLVDERELERLKPGFEALQHGRGVLDALPLRDFEPAPTLFLAVLPSNP